MNVQFVAARPLAPASAIPGTAAASQSLTPTAISSAANRTCSRPATLLRRQPAAIGIPQSPGIAHRAPPSPEPVASTSNTMSPGCSLALWSTVSGPDTTARREDAHGRAGSPPNRASTSHRCQRSRAFAIPVIVPVPRGQPGLLPGDGARRQVTEWRVLTRWSRPGLKPMQYRPGPIDCFLAKAGLDLTLP
jgi:hypothetical protein